MSGLLPLLKLIFDSGAVSPKAPTKVIKPFGGGKPLRPTGAGLGDTPKFGELGLKKYF